MDREITRRDLVHGAGALAIGFAAASGPAAGQPARRRAPAYPPAESGLRGSHRGSFEVAHAVAMDGRSDWGPVAEAGDPVYDLAVVGAGVSGLAAAWFYRKEHPNARILVLDNHDDFGGHAKRNEFQVDGRMFLGHGGSQTLESPSRYSPVAKGLLRDIGVDLARFETAYDRGFHKRWGLASGVYFDAATFGSDTVVRRSDPSLQGFMPLATDGPTVVEAIASYPIAAEARKQLSSLYTGEAGHTHPDWRKLPLAEIPYTELLAHVGIDHPEALKVLDGMPTPLACVGIDAIPAIAASYLLLPMPDGKPGPGLPEPYIHHFPDGNASVARLLVRKLVPEAMPGHDMEDVVTARALYEELDVEGRPARLRLNSTVIHVAHEGDIASAKNVELVYVKEGQATRLRARRCVLACYNMVIPFICPDVPEKQARDLRSLVKSPLVYTNVALRNWRAWRKLGVAAVYSPGRWHHYAYLDFPVSLGSYRYSGGPDEPTVVHMDWEPRSPGLGVADQNREGRRILLRTRFTEIEREVRRHLGGMLGGAGFDPARDIAGLTVNRWPHGYAREPLGPEGGEAPHISGRRPIGRITIANSDAGARAYLDCAIDEAWRAVSELPG